MTLRLSLAGGPRRGSRGRLPLLRQPRARAFRLDTDHDERPHAPGAGPSSSLVRTAIQLVAIGARPVRRQLTARRRGASADRTLPASHDDDAPYTPASRPRRLPVCPARHRSSQVAREFATNAEKTNGRSMVIIGAAMNHWYHCRHELSRRDQHAGDVRLRRPVGRRLGALLSARRSCGRRPAGRRSPSALDWGRPPRQMNSTSAFYAHTDQWRYETIERRRHHFADAPPGAWDGAHHRLQRARRAHGLAAPRRRSSRPTRCRWRACQAAGMEAKDYVAQKLKRRRAQALLRGLRTTRTTGRATCSCGVRTCSASSGKGHEYFLKHLLGTTHGVHGRGSGRRRGRSPPKAVWREDGAGRQARPARSRSTSACPRPASTPTSCCRPRPGTRRTTSTPPTCIPSSIR